MIDIQIWWTPLLRCIILTLYPLQGCKIFDVGESFINFQTNN